MAKLYDEEQLNQFNKETIIYTSIFSLILRLNGSVKERNLIKLDLQQWIDSHQDQEHSPHCIFVLCNYNIVRREQDFFSHYYFDYLILDEGMSMGSVFIS